MRNWVSGLSQRLKITHGGETQFPEFCSLGINKYFEIFVTGRDIGFAFSRLMPTLKNKFVNNIPIPAKSIVNH